MPTLRSLAVLALLTAACGRSDPQTTPLPRNPGIARNPVLQRFSSCGDLERTLEDGLVLQMKSTLEQYRAGWGYGWVGVGGGAMPPMADGASAAAPSAHTSTNTQVEGVGEADFLQNDGTRIAVVAGRQLHLATSWPPEGLALKASVPIEGWPHDLFLADTRAIVFSAVYVPRAIEGDAVACPAVLAPEGDFTCGYWAQNVVKITTFDVADLAAPTVLSEVYLPGSYVSARRIGDRVRLVTSDALPYPEGVSFWPAVAPGATEEEIAAAWDALAARNEGIIRGRSLEDWLRRVTVSRPGVADVEVGHACTDFAAGSGPVRPGILTLSTLDVGAASLVSRTSVLAEPGVVYASPETLYVASRHWWWWPEPGQRDATYLHAFDLRDPDRAGYLGSGVVDGEVRDQYALDEHEGALRVITTVAERVEDGTPWGRVDTAGRLSVLAQEGGALVLVGETPRFGEGERVFGTRFLGSRGFAITARQIDPLFTLDLSDPAHPTVVGELEMPGFISYLHPIDATHLLGVGQEPATATGWPTQLKVALLDVGDLAKPVEDARVLVGESWSQSEALWDPRAFTWLAERNLLALPFAEWGSTTFTSDLRLFRVDAGAGTITAAGRLSMTDVYDPAAREFGWWWSPYVRRSILATDVEGRDYVYAVSDAGIRSAKVAELPGWLATLLFPAVAVP